MNLLREKLRACGHHRAMKGGSSSSNASSNTTMTQNIDRRAVLQDAAYVGDGSTSTVNFVNNSTDGEVMKEIAAGQSDAIKFLTQAGATLVKDAGGAIVDLNRDSITANTKAWDSTLDHGSAMVDSIIDSMSEGWGVAQSAIDKFQPTENKNADIGKYAMVAVAVVAAVVFMKDVK